MEDITTSNIIHTFPVEPEGECFCTDDGWSHVFTFLGKGHYLLLALVSKRFAKLYAKLYSKVTYGDVSGHCLTYAKFFLSEWRQNLPFQPENMHDRIKYRDGTEFVRNYIERCAAKCGTLEILEWIYELEGEYRLERTPTLAQESAKLFRGKLARRMAVVQTCEAAVEANQVQVLNYLLNKYHLIEKDTKFFYKFIKTAAGKGYLQCIKFLYENGCCTNESERIYDCQSAARHGQLECLKYLKDQGWPVDATVMLEAATAGHLHCIQYLRSVGCSWEDEERFVVSEDDITEACAGSSLECLRYCHENDCSVDLSLCCIQASRFGKKDCIEYLRSKGCPLNVDLINEASKYNQLDCLQYLHKNGCPLNKMACSKAIEGNASRCLQYLHENGCEWDPDDLIDDAVSYGKLDCLKYLLKVGTALPSDYESNLILGAIPYDLDPPPPRLAAILWKNSTTHMDCLEYCLQYLIETGQDDSRDLILNAIHHGFVDLLQHFPSEEMKNDTTIAGYAANHGKLECLTYLNENGFRWDENSYVGYLGNTAGMPSHMDCLRYMKRHQLETNKRALIQTIRAGHVYCIDFLIKDAWKSDDTYCMEAIRHRNLNCFELLIEKGFAFDPKLCAIEAATFGNNTCLEYLHMNGHTLPKEALDAAESNGYLDCVEYIKHHFQCECKDETSRKRSAKDAKLNNFE